MQSKEILDHQKIERIIERLAYELWEKNYKIDQLVLAGIDPRGTILADLLAKKLGEIGCDKKVDKVVIQLDKDSPYKHEVSVEPMLEMNQQTALILIDDVLYTGKTLMHAMRPFLERQLGKLQVLVLVHRDYLNFPVRPDFIGTALASTTQEHVSVVIDQSPFRVELN